MSDEPSAASPPPSSPEVSVAPGWHSVDQGSNTQAFWDGERWTRTRRWRGSGWVEDAGDPVAAGAGAPAAAGLFVGAPPPPPRIGSPSPYPPSTAGYQPMPTRPVVQTTNGSAIASLVLSILGLFGIGSLLGIIFGYKARREIRESGGYQSGDGLALAGIIIGFVTLALFALVLALWIAVFTTFHSAINNISTEQSRVEQCQSEVRVVDVAVTAYHAEKGAFPIPPAAWSAVTYEGNYGPLTGAGSGGGPYLTAAPPSSDFVVEYDATGTVWVAPPETFEPSSTATQNTATNPDACEVAVAP